MEQYEDLILEITALAMKANRVTNHHLIINFQGHVNAINIHYLENGYRKGANNRIDLLDVFCNVDCDVFEKLQKCKHHIIALIEGSEDNGKLSDSM